MFYRNCLVLLAAILTASLIVGVATSAFGLRPGDKAPGFELPDVNGDTHRLRDHKGKVLIVDFWATWCGPCKAEVPHFKSLYGKYKDRGFEILAIAMDRKGAKVVKPFVEQTKVDYVVLIGNTKVAKDYGGITAYPTTFIVDTEGKIRRKFVGYRTEDFLESSFVRLLPSKPVKSIEETTSERPSKSKIAVLKFQNGSDEAAAGKWGQGVSRILSQSLLERDEFDAMPRAEVDSILASGGISISDPLELEEVRRAGKALSATVLVTGRVTMLLGEIEVFVWVLDGSTGSPITVLTSSAGSPDEFEAKMDDLAKEMVNEYAEHMKTYRRSE